MSICRIPPMTKHSGFSVSVVNSLGLGFVCRRLYSRTNFKLKRAVALAEWRQ